MSLAIDNMFCIMCVINASNEPMTVSDIAPKTFLHSRTVQRHAMKLATEGLIDFKSDGYKYHYMRKGLKV